MPSVMRSMECMLGSSYIHTWTLAWIANHGYRGPKSGVLGWYDAMVQMIRWDDGCTGMREIESQDIESSLVDK